MNLPNILTLGRIIIIPVFLWSFFTDFPNHYYLAGVLIVISGITDLLDGFLARRFQQTSRLGRILDPLADKLTIITVFSALYTLDVIPGFIILIILGRELFILLGSSYFYFGGKDIIYPSRFGKLTAFSLYSAAITNMLKIKFLNQFFIFIAVPLAVFSGVDYCYRTIRSVFKN
ncbi:MAG: CDP-alcohol phosphatidyltransferase family protein [Halanaerobium sp.]|nr:CDP-alcohol phosphatidyltransferase family protein [Halanaerobium sp.]